MWINLIAFYRGRYYQYLLLLFTALAWAWYRNAYYRKPRPPARIIFLTAQNIIWCQTTSRVFNHCINTAVQRYYSCRTTVQQFRGESQHRLWFCLFLCLLFEYIQYTSKYFPIFQVWPLKYVVLSIRIYVSTTVGTPTKRLTWESLRAYEYCDSTLYQ